MDQNLLSLPFPYMEFDFKTIFNVHLKYLEYLFAKTRLSHQDLKSIGLTGSEVEEEIRALVSMLLPSRFKVVNGYIIYAKDANSDFSISPHVDLIIVDSLAPYSVFSLDKEKKWRLYL